MLNREIFLEDPTDRVIPNSYVAKIGRPETEQQWDVLRFELSQFVCEGEYERGLERILSSYLGSLDRDEQPAVWVSGFYGSGKSHFLRVLEHLWVDTELPDESRARGLVKLPAGIKAALAELTTVGKRSGGLWTATGSLGAGARGSMRLAFLGILFEAAGLPLVYGPARFVIWLKQEGLYDKVVEEVESAGKSFDVELRNFYVAEKLPQVLLSLIPDFASDVKTARQLLKAQFPDKHDISDAELMDTIKDILALKSSAGSKIPCTLKCSTSFSNLSGMISSGRSIFRISLKTYRRTSAVKCFSSLPGSRQWEQPRLSRGFRQGSPFAWNCRRSMSIRSFVE